MSAARTSRLAWRSAPRPRLPRRSKRVGYDGRLQAVANGKAVGWVWDPRDPERRVKVGIEVDEQVLVESVADMFRDDLLKEGMGDGAHGFSIELPDMLQSREHVRLVAVAGPERKRLTASPSFWQEATPGSVWSAVHFSEGREGDPESPTEMPIVVPPAPDSPALQALVGRDGWLFDAAGLTTLQPPTAEVLEGAVRELVRIAHACAEVGVAYVPALVPDKLGVVIEGSPIEADCHETWQELLRARLRDLDEIELLDLGPVLMDARRHGPCFHRSDPDWNHRGAFFVSRALLKEAAKQAPSLHPLPMARLHLSTRPGYRGPLADAPAVRPDGAALVPAHSDFCEEDAVQADLSHLTAERMPVERHLTGADMHVRLHAKPEGGESPRLAIVGDVACLPLLTWLAESGQRTSFFWTPAPPLEPIELELPDALLHLIRYRDLPILAAGQPAAP